MNEATSSKEHTTNCRIDALTPESRHYASIAVIVPVRNEESHIAATLEQLLDLDRENLEVEIMVVDGHSTDRTRAIVAEYAQLYPEIRLCDNPRRLSSAARNIGIQHSQSEFVVVIDGHCEILTRDYLHHVVDAFRTSGADCLGRPQPLFVSDATFLQRAIAVARASWLGHHPASFVYSNVERDVPAISVAVAYRRSVFEKLGLFDEAFDACEDCELNYRIDKAGLHCRFVPQAAVIYRPRSSLRGLFHQLARYGAGRARLSIKHPETFSLYSCAPPAFVGTLILGAVLSLIVQDVWAIVVAVLGISISIVAATSACLALRERNARLFFVLPVVFVIIHSSYTYGFLSQLLQTVKVRSSKERESAKADATQ